MRGAAENVVLRDVDRGNVGEGHRGHAARKQRAERRREDGAFEVELHFLEDLRAVEIVDVESVKNGAGLRHMEGRNGYENDGFGEPLRGSDEPVLR